jgi:hypothetical protein
MPKPLHKSCRIVFLFFFYLVSTGLLPEARIFGQLTQLSGAQIRVLTNTQSGTTYTILATDCGKLITFSNPGSIAVTLPQAGPQGLTAGCWMDIQNLGPGTVTLTPVISLIDQAASLQLTINQGLRLVSTGTGYLTQRGQGAGSSGTGTGTGTVTGTTGALVSSSIVTGNGGLDIRTPAPAATIDSNGNLSIPGTLTANTACNSCAGTIELAAGTYPGSQLSNSFSLIAPKSIGSAYRWQIPSADAAGAIMSDGAGTPGTLSIVPFNGSGNIIRNTAATLRKVCVIDNDTQSSTPLVAAQFSGGCEIPAASSIVEVDVWGGTGVIGGPVTTTGTSSINLHKYSPNSGTATTLLSGNLATVSGQACALSSPGGSCEDGITGSASVTISTIALAQGDWVRVSAATPDGTQTWYRIAVIYTVN